MMYDKVVLDTNFYFNYPEELDSFGKIYLNTTIIEEIDHLKQSDSEVKAYKARVASRAIENAKNIEFVNIPLGNIDLDLSRNDNKIIQFAKSLGSGITLITDDLNVVFKSKCIGVPVVKWVSRKKDDLYTGIRETWITESEYVSLMEGLDKNLYNLYPNEYLIVNNTTNQDQCLLIWNGEYFEEVRAKPISNKYINKINPLDIYQKAFIHMLQNDNIKIKITNSPLGCGKSFLMTHWALQMIDKGKFNKLIFVKSDSPPKNRKAFPAIPGDVNEKFAPHLGVLCDTTSENNLTDILLRNNALEIMPIQFARGRSIKNSIMIINEAQNFTPSEMMLLLSRIDDGSVVLLDGSTQQIDNRYCVHRNGLTVASENLKDKAIAAQVNLVTDFRSEVSKLVGEMDWSD